MSYKSSLICDYLTLTCADADVVDGSKLLFNIPASAYTSIARGDYCLVSVVDGSVNLNGQTANVVFAIKGTLNSYASSSNLEGLIATFCRVTGNTDTVNDCGHMLQSNDIKYLYKQRPNVINLESFKVDGNAGFTATAVVKGFITLKFEYLNKEAVVEQSFGESYTAAFPQV
tara:strand:+ start:254 stop:769 length:516 start_codon:yes stop_codon:yes gene_type:complete